MIPTIAKNGNLVIVLFPIERGMSKVAKDGNLVFPVGR